MGWAMCLRGKHLDIQSCFGHDGGAARFALQYYVALEGLESGERSPSRWQYFCDVSDLEARFHSR